MVFDSPVVKLKFESIFLFLGIEFSNPLVVSQVWNHTQESIYIPIDEYVLSGFESLSSAEQVFQFRAWNLAEYISCYFDLLFSADV